MDCQLYCLVSLHQPTSVCFDQNNYGASQPAGRHTVVWDGKDDAGNPLGGGHYICRMSIDGQSGESQTVVLHDLP